MEPQSTAACINRLGQFCGMRDVPALTCAALEKNYGIAKADWMVLFGGSILAGGDALADAVRQGIAKEYMLVGGEGHTTAALRAQIRAELPHFNPDGLSEAECYQGYLQHRYGIVIHHLETQSTNCGNNVTFCLDRIRQLGMPAQHIILTQDATMQRRMDAGFRKYAQDITLINFAAYAVEVVYWDGHYQYDAIPHGMWPVERYVSLLMGEIPRLTDDQNGYGPRGKGYIAPVHIPKTVKNAFNRLAEVFPDLARTADARFATK